MTCAGHVAHSWAAGTHLPLDTRRWPSTTWSHSGGKAPVRLLPAVLSTFPRALQAELLCRGDGGQKALFVPKGPELGICLLPCRLSSGSLCSGCLGAEPVTSGSLRDASRGPASSASGRWPSQAVSLPGVQGLVRRVWFGLMTQGGSPSTETEFRNLPAPPAPRRQQPGGQETSRETGRRRKAAGTHRGLVRAHPAP